MSDKPFKHLKIENGRAIGRIIVEQNNSFSLLYSDAFKSSQHNSIEGVKVEILNDTLVIKFETKYEEIQSSDVDNIHINASDLLSVTCIDSYLEIERLNQKVTTSILTSVCPNLTATPRTSRTCYNAVSFMILER